mmetsp:Transcript_115555/g.359897  ORF Transcript_115555/g.359897 Transcript_115555/m.359897 type:complete len:267 (+) Transcript_115555:168-968(+)
MPSQPGSAKYGTVSGAPPAATTQKQLMQPASPLSYTHESGEVESDAMLEQASSKNSFKSTRKMAGKAGKAATKGATKMASAFKKGLRKVQAQSEDSSPRPALIGAAEESADLVGSADAADGCDPQDAGLEEDGGEGQEEGEEEAQQHPQSGSAQEKAPTGPRKPPAKQKAVKPCRALQLGSIWEIPTARFPDPIPEPAVEACDLEAQVIGAKRSPLPRAAVSAKAAKRSASKRTSSRKRWCSRRTKVVLGLLVLLAAIVAAVAAAS